MAAMSEFEQGFRQIAAANKGIRLINVYKGVPISYEASIVKIDPWSIQVKMALYQIVCLYKERETFIQNSFFPKIIRAKVGRLDFPDLEASLTGFEYIEQNVGDRIQVRVKPADPIYSDVQAPGMRFPFKAELADISQEGLAIYIPRGFYYPDRYRTGVIIKMSLRFPGEYEAMDEDSGGGSSQTSGSLDRYSRDNVRLYHLPDLQRSGTRPLQPLPHTHKVSFPEITISGKVANVREEQGGNRYRVGLSILLDQGSRTVILSFITQRQAEIIREIQTIYRLLSHEES